MGVTHIGHRLELVNAKRCFGLKRHRAELIPVSDLVGDILSHNQVVFAVHGCLDIVSHRRFGAVGHGSTIRVSQGELALARLLHLFEVALILDLPGFEPFNFGLQLGG